MGHYPDEAVVRVSKSSNIILPGDAKPSVVWHWQYHDENGSVMDGSGPSRDGLTSLAAVKKAVKAKYPKVKVELLVGEDDPDFEPWGK